MAGLLPTMSLVITHDESKVTSVQMLVRLATYVVPVEKLPAETPSEDSFGIHGSGGYCDRSVLTAH